MKTAYFSIPAVLIIGASLFVHPLDAKSKHKDKWDDQTCSIDECQAVYECKKVDSEYTSCKARNAVAVSCSALQAYGYYFEEQTELCQILYDACSKDKDHSFNELREAAKEKLSERLTAERSDAASDTIQRGAQREAEGTLIKKGDEKKFTQSSECYLRYGKVVDKEAAGSCAK